MIIDPMFHTTVFSIELMEETMSAGKNELKGKVTWSVSFTLLATLAISIAFLWKIDGVQICTGLLGGTTICTQINSSAANGGAKGSVVESTPYITATATPPVKFNSRGRGACDISTLITAETDKVKITITSIAVEKTNVNLDHLIIDFIVENLVNKPLTLKLDSNLSIFETGNSDIVAAPELEMSTSPIELEAKGKQAARLSIDRIYDQISNIDIIFRHMIIDGTPVDEETTVSGIPVTCAE